MATNPASVAEAIAAAEAASKKEGSSYADILRAYLREAPEYLSKDDIRRHLGKIDGFKASKDVDNRITSARTDGHLGILEKQADGERRMKNQIARKRGAATITAPPAKRNGGATHTPRKKDVEDRSFHGELTPYMDEAEAVAQRALVDEDISREDLIVAVQRATGAFNGLLLKFNLTLDS